MQGRKVLMLLVKPNILGCIVLSYFLTACSAVCTVPENDAPSSISIVRPSDYQMQYQFSKCDVLAEYRHTKGGMFYVQDITNLFCVNCSPQCLKKKAINDAKTHNANFVVEHTWIQHESIEYYVYASRCPFSEYEQDYTNFITIESTTPSKAELEYIECGEGSVPEKLFTDHATSPEGKFGDVDVYEYGWNIAQEKSAPWVLVYDNTRQEDVEKKAAIHIYRCGMESG